VGVPKDGSAKRWECQKMGVPKSGSAKKWECQNRGAPETGNDDDFVKVIIPEQLPPAGSS
jgi:hypothetical protein